MTSIFSQCFVIHVIDLGLDGFVSCFFFWCFFFRLHLLKVWGFLYFRSKYEFGETILEKLFRGKSSK